ERHRRVVAVAGANPLCRNEGGQLVQRGAHAVRAAVVIAGRVGVRGVEAHAQTGGVLGQPGEDLGQVVEFRADVCAPAGGGLEQARRRSACAARDVFMKLGFGLARLMRYMACDIAGRTSSASSERLKNAVACGSTGADRQALGLPVKIWTALSCSVLIISMALSRPRPVRMCMPIRRSWAIDPIV